MMDVDLASSAYLWHCSRHIWLCLDFRKCRQDEVEGGEWGEEKARLGYLQHSFSCIVFETRCDVVDICVSRCLRFEASKMQMKQNTLYR
jgi:hypothetical protein